MAALTLSQHGVRFIKNWEGDKLKAYQDIVGIWTIGTGHTGSVDGKPIVNGMTITQAKSDALFLEDIAWAVQAINRRVIVRLTQSQFDALVSLIFNIGETQFKNSTLLRKLNSGDYLGASEQFLVWKNAGGRFSQGLFNRRKAEKMLFDSRK